MMANMVWKTVAISEVLQVKASSFLDGVLVEIPENSWGERTTNPPVVYAPGYTIVPDGWWENLFRLEPAGPVIVKPEGG